MPGDGWCLSCGDDFNLDDCGGYNPPCPKCGECRSCCGGQCEFDEDMAFDYDDHDVSEDGGQAVR